MDQLVAVISNSPLAGGVVVLGYAVLRLYRDQRADAAQMRQITEAQTAASIALQGALVNLTRAIEGMTNDET
jgi:hypothetical protein